MIIEKKIRQSILTELKKVNKQDTPILFKIIQTRLGRKRIEKKIEQRIIEDFLPLSAIIPYMENENCL